MFTTEQRPAPLPARPATPVLDQRAVARVPLPEGAARWSKTWLDSRGLPQTSGQPVPVDDDDRRTPHVRYACRGHIEVAGQRRPCDHVQWLMPGETRYCPDHGAPLEADAAGRQSGLPTAEMWAVCRERVYVGGIVAATAATGVAAEVAPMPWWGITAQMAALPAVVAGSYWATSWWLTRQQVHRGNLDPGDEVAGKRRRKLIARRARYAGYCTAAAGLWVQIADACDIDLSQPSGWTLLAVLASAGVVAARPYLRHVDGSRAVPAEPVEVETIVQPSGHEQLVAYVTDRWRRLCAPGRSLPGTRLEGVRATAGDGWQAMIVADDESDLDPDKFASDTTVRKIARAYSVGTSMVTVTADPFDANRALILVQQASPLADMHIWDGSGIDQATGRAETATLDDGTRISHEFWRPGWGAVMELIAGCTGSGKSEYLNLLLALERQSRMVVSWVADPQMGQSLGDVRDGVDWFAPTTEELLLMLQTAVAVVLARNLATTRLRVQETRPDGRVVQRRVKYVEVSEDNPLLSITVDEAHLPMNDPDHGKMIVKLMALLSKAGRKCNVKLRILTQSPLLSELKDSVLRAQLASGLVVVFRTADRLTGAAAWPGRMPADPANLPPVWPDSGKTTAGLGYMSGQRPMRMRTDYPGDLYDLMHDGVAPGLEEAMLGTAGLAYKDRWRRLKAFDAMDPAELLGAGIPDLRATQDDDMSGNGEGRRPGAGREAVLAFLAQRWMDGDRDQIQFGELNKNVKAVKTRTLSNVLKRLVADGLLVTDNGGYALSDRGAEELGLVEEDDD